MVEIANRLGKQNVVHKEIWGEGGLLDWKTMLKFDYKIWNHVYYLVTVIIRIILQKIVKKKCKMRLRPAAQNVDLRRF